MYFPCLGHANYLVLPIEAPENEVPPVLRLDQADHALQAFIIRKLHQRKRINGMVVILPPVCGKDPSTPAEFIVQNEAKLWANKHYTTPVVPGSTTKEWAALNEVMTCPLEANAGECKVLLTESAFIHFGSEESKTPSGPTDELANPPTDELHDDATDETPEILLDETADQPNDDLMDVPLNSPDRMDTHDDKAADSVGSIVGDSQSDAETIDNADSEVEGVENHCKQFLSKHELSMLSSSDSEDGNARVRDQLLIMKEKLDKDKRQDSGCGETSDGSTTNIGPLLGDGQTWSIPQYQARPINRAEYLATLEQLVDKQMIAATQLDQNFAYTSISLLNMIEEGFVVTGGIAKSFVEGMTGLAMEFFRDARQYESEIMSANAVAFCVGLENLRHGAMGLIEEAAALEQGYEESKLKFNVILRKTMKTVWHYLNKACNYNIRTYHADTFGKLAKHMDIIDVGQFVPIIIMNASTHQALLSSQRFVQSWMPLLIAIAPLMLNICMASGQMQFLNYVSQCSVSLEDKVGPWLNIVPPPAPAPGTVASLESDSNLDKGHDPPKATPVPEPMDTMGELMLGPWKVEPTVKAKHKPKEPAKEEPKVDVTLKGDSKDESQVKAKPPSDPKGEPSQPPVVPEPPVGLASQSPPTPTTTATILVRIKKKTGTTPVPPVPIFPNMSVSVTSTTGGKDDLSKGLPSKWKKTAVTMNSHPKDGSTIEVSSSSDEGTNKAKTKSGGKRKRSSKKPKSAATVETEMSDKATSPKKHSPLPPLAINKQAGHHENKWCEDLRAVKDYRGRRNIYSKELNREVNANDESDYIKQMAHDESLGLNIYDVKAIKKWYKAREVNSDRVKYEQLKELMGTPMCKEKDAKVLYLVECFVHPKTKQCIAKGDENGFNSQVMVGLYGLHYYKAISKVTTSDTGLPETDKCHKIMEGYCLFWAYSLGNDPSLNNHIRMHEHLGLLCIIGKCFHIKWQAEKMCKHAVEIHKITWVDPVCKPSKGK